MIKCWPILQNRTLSGSLWGCFWACYLKITGGVCKACTCCQMHLIWWSGVSNSCLEMSKKIFNKWPLTITFTPIISKSIATINKLQTKYNWCKGSQTKVRIRKEDFWQTTSVTLTFNPLNSKEIGTIYKSQAVIQLLLPEFTSYGQYMDAKIFNKWLMQPWP